MNYSHIAHIQISTTHFTICNTEHVCSLYTTHKYHHTKAIAKYIIEQKFIHPVTFTQEDDKDCESLEHCGSDSNLQPQRSVT